MAGGRDGFRQSIYLLQWRRTSLALFQQLSEDQLEEHLPLLLGLLGRPSLLDSIKYVGALLSAAVWANPTLTLAKALPSCFAALLAAPAKQANQPQTEGAAEADAGGALHPLSESELTWWVSLCSHLVRKAGSAVLPYMTQLTAVLRLTPWYRWNLAACHTCGAAVRCASVQCAGTAPAIR